jgi:aspartate/methionine/tyrosine aminotransferase
MHRIGWPVPKPAATMYVWAKLPERWQNDSMGFTVKMVENVGVAAAAGSGYGPSGEGYVRFALVQNTEVLEEAVRRIERFLQTA